MTFQNHNVDEQIIFDGLEIIFWIIDFKMLNKDLLGFQDFRNPQMSVKKELKIQRNIS